MTLYEEMLQTAEESQKRWILRDGSAKHFIGRFLEKFRAYCEMSADRIKLLPWNEEKKVYQAKSSEDFLISQAVSFNGEENEWRVGLCLWLNIWIRNGRHFHDMFIPRRTLGINSARRSMHCTSTV